MILNQQNPQTEDYSYIIKIIQHLDFSHHINLFISTKDFDVLYRWWEKRIPLKVVTESIDRVIERWKLKNRNINSYANFSHEVKKNFKVFMEMRVGQEGEAVDRPEFSDLNDFLNQFPEELSSLKDDFINICELIKKGSPFSLNNLFEKLLDLFKEDQELNTKTQVFLRNLSSDINHDEITHKYKLNYLKTKFHVPEFDLYLDE